MPRALGLTRSSPCHQANYVDCPQQQQLRWTYRRDVCAKIPERHLSNAYDTLSCVASCALLANGCSGYSAIRTVLVVVWFLIHLRALRWTCPRTARSAPMYLGASSAPT